jgi:acetamidase/formamidase
VVIELKRVSFKDTGLKYTLSPFDKPVVVVRPKESLVVDVEDAASGRLRNDGDYRDRGANPYGNPVVGPIYVEGVEVGDALSVRIGEIMPTIGRGVTYLSEFNEGYVAGTPIIKFLEVKFPRKPRICRIDAGWVHFSPAIKLPYRPMVGTIGVAPRPEEESLSSSVLPGNHGGNLDLPDIRPTSTVFLPVFYQGALLYLGDVHATQGDGEISGTAVEMPAEIQITVDVLKAQSITSPRIETQREIMCVATTSKIGALETAVRTAFLELITWMEADYGINRFDGLMLCSQIARIRIGNLWTVAAAIEKQYLKRAN